MVSPRASLQIMFWRLYFFQLFTQQTIYSSHGMFTYLWQQSLNMFSQILDINSYLKKMRSKSFFSWLQSTQVSLEITWNYRSLSLVIILPLIDKHTKNACLRKCLLNHTKWSQLTTSFLSQISFQAKFIEKLPLR